MTVQSPYAEWLGALVGTYRLEQLLEHGTLGPVFLGRERTSGAAVRLRILAVSPAQTPDVAATYQATLEREAAPLAALANPYLLPLTDFGIHQGLPYLVWPHLVMRPLSARLAQSGPMDVVTVGRYVDQIATALEAGRERSVLHRNLSADCVFIQLDGQTVVADVGIRRLLELFGAGDQTRPFFGSVEACAPEQLRDEHIGPYTDVYALGALTYRMLTGQPVFVADSLDALLQQHLYGAVPSVRERRPGLPGALDPFLAKALAKEPTGRFSTPGAFADAYHEVISPGHANRVPFTARTAAARLSPQRASSDPLSNWGSSASSPSALHDEDDPRRSAQALLDGAAPSAHGVAVAAPSQSRRGAGRRRSGIIATVLLVLLFVSGGVFILDGGKLLTGVAARESGTAAFVDSPNGPPGHTDALRLSATGLPAPPTGAHYVAWVLDQQTEHVVRLGTLSAAGQAFTLSYDGDGANGQPGTNLLGVGNQIEITLEHGDSSAPLGAVALAGRLPPHADVHIQHLLTSFPTTPDKIGLLVGLLGQTQELDAQASVLQNAAANHNTAAVQCGAQSILDIIEGTRGTNYRPLPAACAALNVSLIGDGYGLLASGSNTVGYLDGAADHASLAATQDDTTPEIRTHAGHVEIAIANIKGWVTAAQRDAIALLKTPGDAATAADLVAQCDHAYHGVPGSTDQQVNPVPGQAGAITAYEHGQFMANITLAPPPAR